MKILDLTPGSTHAVNVAITTYMPPAEATKQLAICNQLQAEQAEVQRLQAEVQRLQPMVPNPTKARSDRTQDIEDLVLLALDNATLRADMLRVNHAFRTSKVIDHLNYFKEDHGDVKKRYDIKKAPSRAKVRAILQQQGYVPF
jgi:hypothetical protein